MDKKVWSIFGKDLKGSIEPPRKQGTLTFQPLTGDEKKRKVEENDVLGKAMEEAKKARLERDVVFKANLAMISEAWGLSPNPPQRQQGIF
jgi:hypothetical protein